MKSPMSKLDYSVLPDEHLAALAREKDEKAAAVLITRMTPLVRARSAGFHKFALEQDDLAQEGMMALLKAIRTYDGGLSGASFRTYAGVCVYNRISSLIRAATAKKQAPLNESLSLEDSLIPDTGSPEEQIIATDELENLKKLLYEGLSRRETEVMKLYLSGYGYREIAEKLGAEEKSVDNALQRVKRKFKNLPVT